MATLATSSATLADIANRSLSDGGIDPQIIDILRQSQDFSEDAEWVMCNDGSSNKTTVATGYPEGAWRLFNYGVPQEVGKTAQVSDATGMLQTFSKIDADLLAMNGNSAAWRMSEEKLFIAGLNKTMTQTAFYGTGAAKFIGLAPRYSSLSAENGENIIDAGGTGSDNTSIWIVTWDQTATQMIYPKGSVAGLQAVDLGEDTVTDGAGGEYQAVRTHFKWHAGLTVRDWRKNVRIANIDVSDLTKNASAGADLVDLIVRGLELIENDGTGRVAIYCNKTIRSYLRRQISNKTNVNLTLDTVGGKRVVFFDGYPVRRVDALLNTEARVV